jgi:hypothetical protein
LDPQSKVRAPATCYAGRAGFQAGIETERLFLRHVREGGWIGSLAAHAFTVTADVLRGLPHPACLTQLLGRAAAWTAFSSQRQRHRELAQLISAAQPAARKSGGNAIPRPHIGVFAAQRVSRDAA